MANSILKLKVESSEYDAKLKKAAEGIRHLAEVAHKGGGELTGLEKAELDYVKALGSMETKSRTAAGSVRELESTYKELKVIYDQLNDVEKADEGGKALAASLEQIKQRAQEAKAQLDNASKSLNDNGQSAEQSGGILESLASKFTLNIDALKLFDMGLSATKAALDVAMDAFFASEANVDEWGRIVASSQSLYEGFLTAINNGDISGYLSNIDSIVEAARKAYDELDKLGTMKTIQAPQISKQQTENERIRQMIQTGRYIAPQDGRTNAVFNGRVMQNGDKLTAGQIRAMEKQLSNGMQSVTKLVGNEVKQTGKAIDAYYNKIAKTNGMTLQEFKKGTSSWDEFSKKMAGYDEYKKWDTQSRIEFAKQGGRGFVDFDKNNPYAEFKKWGTFRVDKDGENSYKELVSLIQQRDQQVSQMYSTQTQAFRTMNRAEGFTVSKLMGKGGGSGSGTKNEPPALEGSIDAQTQKVQDLQKAWRAAADDDSRQKIKAQLDEAQRTLTTMTGVKLPDPVIPGSLKAYSDQLKESQADVVKMREEILRMKEAGEAPADIMVKQDELDDAIDNLNVIQKKIDELNGKTAKATIDLNINTGDFNGQTYIQKLQEQLLADAQNANISTLGDFMNRKLREGIEGADLEGLSALLRSKIFPEDADDLDEDIDTFIESLKEKLGDKIKNGEWEAIKLAIETGDFTGMSEENKKEGNKDFEDFTKGLNTLTAGLSSVSSGLKNIGVEVPKEVDQVIGVINGVSQVITGVQTVISLFGAGAMASNTAAVLLNTGAIGGLIAALYANTAANIIPFANGGVVPTFAQGGLIGRAAAGMFVPGNSMSGDRLRLPVDGGRGVIGVNSGELILNKSSQNSLAASLLNAEALIGSIKDYSASLGNAQQTILAAQLEGSPMGDVHLDAVIGAEDIQLVINNRGRRTGRGEYVQSRNRRQ